MVVLDFGPSDYERRSPGVSYEELANSNKILVPEQGSLDPIKRDEERGKSAAEISALENWVKRAKVRKGSIITIDFMGGMQRSNWNYKDELQLSWIDERGEWIGIRHERWYESDAWGSDWVYLGPFGLDEKYARKILEAFGIPEERLSPEGALHTGPTELEKLASGQG